MGQSLPLFRLFSSFPHEKTINYKSLDGMLGTRTQGGGRWKAQTNNIYLWTFQATNQFTTKNAKSIKRSKVWWCDYSLGHPTKALINDKYYSHLSRRLLITVKGWETERVKYLLGIGFCAICLQIWYSKFCVHTLHTKHLLYYSFITFCELFL